MPQSGLVSWSQTAANNATADAAVNYAEGQAPSSLNDSARAAMASAAKYRDDIAGAIITGGTSTAYTVTSYQQFSALSVLAGQMIAFTPHTTSGATVTLNVDSLGAKPLRSAPAAELPAGVLIQGTPYLAVYNNSDGAFYLHGFYGNPYNIPLAGGMDFWGITVPNSSFAFPAGQAISRTTYASLFAIMGTTYGSGDGSTTFNLPDKTGRVSAMKEASATRLTSSYFGGNSANMGAVGGLESDTLTASQIPSITSTGSFASNQTGIVNVSAGTTQFSANAGSQVWQAWKQTDTVQEVQITGSLSVNSSNTGGTAHNNVQPTIICNYIIRII